MSTENQKQQYLQKMKEVMTQLGQLGEMTNRMTEVYIDREYDAAAADAITDAQLADFGIIQYHLGTAFSLLGDITTLLNNATNQATINRWRQV